MQLLLAAYTYSPMQLLFAAYTYSPMQQLLAAAIYVFTYGAAIGCLFAHAAAARCDYKRQWSHFTALWDSWIN
jgi:hypothetical protein